MKKKWKGEHWSVKLKNRGYVDHCTSIIVPVIVHLRVSFNSVAVAVKSRRESSLSLWWWSISMVVAVRVVRWLTRSFSA